MSEDLDPYEGSQHIVLVLSPSVEFEYPLHTLAPPALHALNEFVSREMAVDPWKLRVEANGVALIHQLHDSADWLYPIPHKEIILKLFNVSGITATTNAAGLLAEKIIASMREEDPLEACRVFKIRGVRKLLKDTPADARISWNAAIAAIGKENFSKFKKLHIESRRNPELKPEDAFAFLIKKKVFSPKLVWWRRLLRTRREFACPVCGLKSKIPARSFEGLWLCECCREEQDLRPLVVSQLHRHGKEWAFQRAGFFSKENNQEGAIPVILTLLQLKRRLRWTSFMYSSALSLTMENQLKCEVDFVVVQPGRRGPLEIGIAECKDQGGKIDAGDVDNLRSVAERLSKMKMKPYLIFSKTADSFSQEETELFRGLTKDRVFPILFTNKELEPYQPYEEVSTIADSNTLRVDVE